MPGNDSFTKLLLHGNGSDGSTTITDSSSNGYSGTAVGNAQIDTAQSKFGGASILMDGTGDRVEFADQADWDFDGGDFTIDLWVRLANTSGNNMFCGRVTNSNSYFYFGLEGNNLRFRDWIGSNNIDIQRTVTISTGTWYHFAVSRNGNNWRLFQDGTQLGSTVSSAITMTARAVKLDVGAMVENASYVMNGWIDEFRWSKGTARYTANFTPETVEYDNATNDSFSATELDGTLSIQAPTVVIDTTITPSVLELTGLAIDPDNIGNVVIFEPDVLELTADIQAPTETISSTVSVSPIDLVSSIVSPSFPGLNTAKNTTKIISFNPLIMVSDTNPAKVTVIDTSDPNNPTWDTHILDEGINAQDCYFNEETEFIYIACASGKVIKIDYNDFSNQETIDLSDTDNVKVIDSIPAHGVSIAGTDSESGEIYLIDERETFLIEADMVALHQEFLTIPTDFRMSEAFNIDAELQVLGLNKYFIYCDFQCLTDIVENITPINLKNWHLFIDNVEVVDPDLSLDTISITHSVDQESVATFRLNRRHDDLNHDLEGNVIPITSQNNIRIEVNGHVEFPKNGYGTAKISDIDCSYDLSGEFITITATATQPEYQFNTVTLPLPSIDKHLGLYDVLVQNPKISNPYIDPTAENPKKYLGISVDLGKKIVQNHSNYFDSDPFGDDAEAIQNGTFVPLQNWTYFWGATVIKPSIIGQITRTVPTIPQGSQFYNFKLPVFQLPEFRFPGTAATGTTSMLHFLYIGTSLAPVSSDIWVLKHAERHRQRIYDNIETELGTYTVGSAPFKTINPRNGQFISKFKYVDENNGLYSVKDESYNYIEFAKKCADLEYQKLLNINGQILPDTSATLKLTIDNYYYKDLRLLTRVNIDNTWQPGTFKDNNGFPISIKSVTIDSSSMSVQITGDNTKSSFELAQLDDQFPDDEDPQYLFPEVKTFIVPKSDMKTGLQVE